VGFKSRCKELEPSVEFGLDKCANIALEKGRSVPSQNLTLYITRATQELEEGTEESEGVEHQRMEERLKDEHVEITNDTEARGDVKSKVTATCALAVRV
jgi:DnaJ-domain-containing protein 1